MARSESGTGHVIVQEIQGYAFGAMYPLETSRAFSNALTQSDMERSWVGLTSLQAPPVATWTEMAAAETSSGSSQITITSSSPKTMNI